MRLIAALLGIVMAFSAGCSEEPSRTPSAPPVDSNGSGTDAEPIPTAPELRRIETH